jgi:predicted ATPase/DNA-binding XRE family transcriptional regulator
MDQEHILAELLRRLRVRAGLSQEKLGSAAGVNARTISDLERSVTHYPRAGTAYRIADALGLAGAERENWLALATPVHAAATHAPDVAVTGDFTATILAAAVRELREQRGLSARELGQRAGLSLRTITDIEAGKRQRIHLQNAARLADELRLAGHARERFLRLAEGPAAAEPFAPEEPEEPEEARPGLFGRERELAEVTELLRRSPLVVLTGPGGVGKTTLAEAVLAGLDRPQLTLDLTRVPAGEELARAIAVIARFDEDTAAGWVGQLGALLPPDAVLLLDNLEHLRAVPEAVAAIRAAHPGLTVLATSRTLSGLDDGIEYAIGPLPVRAACQVFLDVAGRSGRPPPARVTSALIEEVCVRLDRLPLTIILAAAWSRLMTPQEILARLGPPDAILRAVAKPGQGPPERHATVTSTVGWSLALVSEPARALFRALSASPAPWPLGLVEAVGAAARLDPLHELVEAGLVSVADNDAGGTSYTMLQTVRDVGHRELSDDPGGHGEVLERHAAYLLERAGVLGPELFTAGRLTALVECDQLAPHVQAAFEYLIRSADGRAVSLAAAWWRYFFHRGQYRRGLAIVSRALEVRPAAGQASGRDRAAALYGAAALASYAGEHRQATGYAEDALARASALGDSYLAGSVISLIGMMEFYAGRNEVALGWFQHGLAEVDGESEPQTYATLLTNAAPVYAVLGDIAAARATAEDAARRCQALDNLAGVAANLGNLAEWAARVGDRDRARELLGECRELQKSLGDSYNVVQCLLSLGKLAADEGDAATAREELDAARQELEGTENPWCDAYCDALAAQIEALNGNMTGALTYARLAVRKGEPLGYQPAIATAALADAAAAAWSGNQPRTLESAALGLRQSDQAGEAAVVSLALLVAAVRMDGISPALVGEDVLALERLIRQWASVPGCAPYPIAVHSARRRGLRLPPDRPGTSARHQVPPIGELRELALALCGPGPAGRAGRGGR